jgi:hypothetical protein
LRKATVLRPVVGSIVVVGVGIAALLRASSASHVEAEEDVPAAIPPSVREPVVASTPPGPSRSPSSDIAVPSSAAIASLNEAVLMARLRRAAGTDLKLSVELARAGNRRFPDSADAPERASILIHALAAEGEAREARREAEYAVNHYPDSSWVRDIERFTGAHRHRNIRITDAGTVEYQ